MKVLPSKSWIICFELLHCYQKGRQQPVWGGTRSVCLKTRTGIFQPRGTMGKEWRLTGGGSWRWVWLTAIGYLWDCVYFCLVESSVDCLAPQFLRGSSRKIHRRCNWTGRKTVSTEIWCTFVCVYDKPTLHSSTVAHLSSINEICDKVKSKLRFWTDNLSKRWFFCIHLAHIGLI